jgi:hypothetical protein
VVQIFNFPAFVIFMDEAHFARDKIKNFHNQHMWVDENSHAILPSHHQQQFPINILADICGDNLFGPNTLPNMHTWRNYKAFLENNMPDFLAHMPLIIHKKLDFMYDCGAAYFSLVSLRYMVGG